MPFLHAVLVPEHASKQLILCFLSSRVGIKQELQIAVGGMGVRSGTNRAKDNILHRIPFCLSASVRQREEIFGKWG
jgi:hypothetical protein